jgi:hypothetical protein
MAIGTDSVNPSGFWNKPILRVGGEELTVQKANGSRAITLPPQIGMTEAVLWGFEVLEAGWVDFACKSLQASGRKGQMEGRNDSWASCYF